MKNGSRDFSYLEYFDPDEAGRWEDAATKVGLPRIGRVPVGNMFGSLMYERNDHNDNHYAKVFAIWFHRDGECVGGGELCFPEQGVACPVPLKPDSVTGIMWDAIEGHGTPEYVRAGCATSGRCSLGIVPQSKLYHAASCDKHGYGLKAERRAKQVAETVTGAAGGYRGTRSGKYKGR